MVFYLDYTQYCLSRSMFEVLRNIAFHENVFFFFQTIFGGLQLSRWVECEKAETWSERKRSEGERRVSAGGRANETNRKRRETNPASAATVRTSSAASAVDGSVEVGREGARKCRQYITFYCYCTLSVLCRTSLHARTKHAAAAADVVRARASVFIGDYTVPRLHNSSSSTCSVPQNFSRRAYATCNYRPAINRRRVELTYTYLLSAPVVFG